jgi:hypothetical protein
MATIRGGRKFEAALAALADKVAKPATLRVGWLENSRYPDGTPTALAAAMTEYGNPSRGQPPRPAFRNMIAEKHGEWPSAIAGLLRDNDFDAKKALELAGTAIAGQLRESIATITSPPLAPSTIKRKGSDKPWIESGHALNSVDFEVKS